MARDLGTPFLLDVRRWDRHQLVDMLVAALIGAATEVEALIDAHGYPALLAGAAPSGIVIGGLLLLRRKRPLLSMTLFSIAAVLSTVVQVQVAPAGVSSPSQVVPIFAIAVLGYSVGAFGSRRDLLLGLPQPLVVVAVIDRLQPSGQPIIGALVFFALFVVGVPALGGRLVRGRQRLLEELAEQRRQLDIQRAIQTRTALATERLQLAERLHQDLAAGLESLVTEANAAASQAAAAAIETRARALLGQTRNVVVSLAAAEPASHPAGPAAGSEAPAASGSDEDEDAERTDPEQRLNPVHPAVASTVIAWTALAAAAVGTGLLVQVSATHGLRAPMPAAVLGCLLIAAPLAVIWSRPLIMTAALWTAAALFSAFVTPLGPMFAADSLAFAPAFMVAYFADRRRAAAGLGICCLGGALCFGWDAFIRQYDFVFVLAAWVVGRVLATRSGLIRQVRSNNQLLAGQREAGLRQAITEERARIARDLHDSIGHHLTIIALQAGAARRLWTSDPPKAQAAFAAIAEVAARGSAELRLGLDTGLTLVGGTPPHASVAALLGNARAAGLKVTWHADRDEPDLPGDIELAVFRVLQEALTNVLRHAPGATADVTFRSDRSHVELVVANSAGDQPSTWASGSSRGQHGMRRRVEEHGGRLDYGRRPGGGFEVRAWFPRPETP